MARKSAVRTVINLSCEDCSNRLYTSEKNRRNSPDRIELKNSVKFVDHTKILKKWDLNE